MKPDRKFPSRTVPARYPELPPRTDWTRVLYCDITGSCDAGPLAWLLPRKEIDMNASRFNGGDRGAPRSRAAPGAEATRPHTDESLRADAAGRAPRSPLKHAVMLLGIYVAMYGTVGLLVHVAQVLADDVAASLLPALERDGEAPAVRGLPGTIACAPSTEGTPCAQG